LDIWIWSYIRNLDWKNVSVISLFFIGLSQIVNFTNILRINFSYECCFSCFSLVTCTLKKLLKRHSFVKTLMKLTHRHLFRQMPATNRLSQNEKLFCFSPKKYLPFLHFFLSQIFCRYFLRCRNGELSNEKTKGLCIFSPNFYLISQKYYMDFDMIYLA